MVSSGLRRPPVPAGLADHDQAVAVRRELAAANPDRHRPDLAAALNNLGIRLAELGRPPGSGPGHRGSRDCLPGAGCGQP